MGQLFKEHQIALSAAATADFKALLNEVCAPVIAASLSCEAHASPAYPDEHAV